MNQPNFVFILIDDMGWKDIGCNGSEFYETPNIDRLAAEGMSFTDAYAACPVCSPTRASIMTGKYPARVGVTDWIDFNHNCHPMKGKVIDASYIDHLPSTEKSIAASLKEGGYNTWHVGKWHLGGDEFFPDKHGFDVNIGGCHIGCPYNGYFSPWGIETLEEASEGTYLTDHLTDQAIALIKRNPDQPFFLNLCYYSVHTPIQAKVEYIEKFRAKAVEMGLDKVETFKEGESFPCERKKDQHVLRRLVQSDPVYAAMIYSLDENIGRVLQTIEETGRGDNTMIVFTSDNGGLSTAEGSPTCNAPLSEGKGWMYEGGTREPLIIRWRDQIEKGSSCSVPVTSPDFYPTLLDAAGLPPNPEQHCDGVSMLNLLKGGDKLERDAIFWHYPHYGNQGGTPGASMRKGDYKLIKFFEDEHLELYNLRDDISEENNLVCQLPDLAEELHQQLNEWLDSCDAIFPEPNPDYSPWE